MDLFFVALIGLAAGGLDIAPMIKMKLDRHSIVSAFVFHFIAPFVLYWLKAPLPFWLGGVVYLVLALPTIILVARDDKKSAPIMAITSLVMGTVVGLVLHFI